MDQRDGQGTATYYTGFELVPHPHLFFLPETGSYPIALTDMESSL